MARILVCEDSATLCAMYRDNISSDGHEVSTAGDGMSGFSHFLEHQPDLLVTDFDMPLMNGLELIKAVRAKGFTTPVILVSGSDTWFQGCLGEIAVLNKPAGLRKIRALVNAML